MNVYDERQRIILSEIGMVTLALLDEQVTINEFTLIEKLDMEWVIENNPARRGILKDAIKVIQNGR